MRFITFLAATAALTLVRAADVAEVAADGALEGAAFLPAQQTSLDSPVGPFQVSSLARSSSYSFNSNLPQTTTFAPGTPNIAAPESRVTPSYFNDPTNTQVPLVSFSTNGPISITGTASAATAPSARPDGAMARAAGGAGVLAVAAAAAAFGAAYVL